MFMSNSVKIFLFVLIKFKTNKVLLLHFCSNSSTSRNVEYIDSTVYSDAVIIHDHHHVVNLNVLLYCCSTTVLLCTTVLLIFLFLRLAVCQWLERRSVWRRETEDGDGSHVLPPVNIDYLQTVNVCFGPASWREVSWINQSTCLVCSSAPLFPPYCAVIGYNSLLQRILVIGC